ncbi:MAG: hypothetical protein Kow00129_06320 [Thermoleophilia bacterium]
MEMSSPRTTAVTGPGASAVGEAGKAIALAVVLTMGAVYVPLVSAVFAFMLPLPVAYVTLRHGFATGGPAALGAGMLAGLITGPVNGLTALLLAGAVGVVLGTGLRRSWGFSKLLLLVTAVSGLALAVLVLAAWFVSGVGIGELENVVDESFASARELYVAAGMERAMVEAAEEEARRFLRVLPYLAPGLIGIVGLVYAAGAGALTALVFPRLGEPGAGKLSFSRFRLHWAIAYGFIAGLGLLVVSGWSGSYQGVLQLAGLNLFLFFQALYFLQGLALARWLDRARGLGALGKTALYGGAVLAQAFFMLTSWVGLLDTWFDYRKRFPGGARRDGVAGKDSGSQDEED